jgi:PTH1 family peptidyl-tRNA hydrolase
VRIIAGLGNPGRKYLDTRHNIGWMVLDRLAEEHPRCGEESRCGGLLTRCGDVILFKPLGFMNRSGPPVAQLWREVGIDLQDVLIVLDDLNLPLGSVRLRPRGSGGNHRGLESVIGAFGREDIPRLRLGIGPSPSAGQWREFVLTPFAEQEAPEVERMTDAGARAAWMWANEGVDAAMNEFNRKVEDS